MGYARYDTPLGPAGYAVLDTCHQPGCAAEVDRGLAFLCGGTPGAADGHGCGQWFCGAHLLGKPDTVDIMGDGLCASCLERWKGNNPDLLAAEEARFERDVAAWRAAWSGTAPSDRS
jgi:hypothetical protein